MIIPTGVCPFKSAFRVAFNDLVDPGQGHGLEPLVDRNKAEVLVDEVMTFEGSRKNVRKARSLAIDIAQTPIAYKALSFGYAQEGITVKVKNDNVSSSLSYQYRYKRDIIELNIGTVDIWHSDTSGQYVRSVHRTFAHELGHVFAGDFQRYSFTEQDVVDNWENPITMSLNLISLGFGQRANYNDDVTSIPKNAVVYK